MSFVYFIKDATGNVKIGKADNVVKRLAELQTAASSKLELLGTITCSCSDNAFSVEGMLHVLLESSRVTGEWYSLMECHVHHIIKEYKNVSLEFNSTKEPKMKYVPNTYLVGNGETNKHGIESIDLLDEVMSMTKAEQLVVSTIKNLYTWDNQDGEVHIPLSKMFDKSGTKVFLKGFGLLKKKDLVRRTKRSHYMINPKAIYLMDYHKGAELWNESGEANDVENRTKT